MIYISSSCIQENRIADSVKKLAEYGFTNVELSGGTTYYPGWEDELLELKKTYSLNFLLHNYFPPPAEAFVLNLASLDFNVYEKTVEHILNALAVSSRFGADRYGFHAGYYLDPSVSELGRQFTKFDIVEDRPAFEQFCKGFKYIQEEQTGTVELYIENNVISKSNFETFGRNPFMLTSSQEYLKLREKIEFKLLLDVAHLKVSSNTLGFDFREELSNLLPHTDYIHISDNDGFHDQNRGFKEKNGLLTLLGEFNLAGKMITMEVYEEPETLIKSFNRLRSLL